MHDEFLTALRATPNDDVTRLVYADWLDEQGDPLSEFLRLEVQAAADGLPDDERTELTNRLAALSRAAEPRWLVAVNRTPFVRCKLRRRMGSSPLDGVLELANYSSRTMLVTTSPYILQYLHLTITSPLAEVTSGPYAEYGPPRLGGPQTVLRLTPGERSSVHINLLNLLHPSEVTIGAYTVDAAFVYDRVTSRADAVRVELTDDDRRKWRLGRYVRA